MSSISCDVTTPMRPLGQLPSNSFRNRRPSLTVQTNWNAPQASRDPLRGDSTSNSPGSPSSPRSARSPQGNPEQFIVPRRRSIASVSTNSARSDAPVAVARRRHSASSPSEGHRVPRTPVTPLSSSSTRDWRSGLPQRAQTLPSLENCESSKQTKTHKNPSHMHLGKNSETNAHHSCESDDASTNGSTLPRLVTVSSSRPSSPSRDDDGESQADFDRPTWTMSYASERLKTSEDIDKEFEEMFAPPDNPVWDPEIGATPTVVSKNGIYGVVSKNGIYAPDEAPARRAVSASYINTLVPEGIDGVKSSGAKPEDEGPKSSGGGLSTVIQSLAVVRGRLARIRARNSTG